MYQDRLIKKIRRKKIATYEAANEYLEKQYLPEDNRRFARVAAKTEDYHGRKPTAGELREVFRLEAERTISKDWVLRHEGRYLQLKPGCRNCGSTRSKALVCEWEHTKRGHFQEAFTCANNSVGSKLKCPVFIASEMSGLG